MADMLQATEAEIYKLKGVRIGIAVLDPCTTVGFFKALLSQGNPSVQQILQYGTSYLV
jgi:hypothetical protein